MTIINSALGLYSDFLLNEANGKRSRDEALVTQTGTKIESGTVMRLRDSASTGTATANAGNTGNPTFGSITIGAAGKVGTYTVTFTAATKFDVEDPDGVVIGSGTTGVAFSKQGVGFTLTAGGTPAVAGDGFTIAVAPATGKWVPYVANDAGTLGILYERLAAATGDKKAVIFSRDCEVSRVRLIGLDANAERLLAQRGVIVRGVYTTV